MAIKNVYLTSTLDLLEAFDSVYSTLNKSGYTMIAPDARSLKMRVNAEDIKTNIEKSDVVIFLIGGTDINSLFIDIDGMHYDPVEAEFEITHKLVKAYHAFLPSGAWQDRVINDAKFMGAMSYRLRDKAEIDNACTLCDSPRIVSESVLQWLSSIKYQPLH